ncbi:MAG: NADP-dependent oxidoreductase [Ginsengibacter sp.]|jgi:NADPH:quinone reductase-like Zn-dependent oxidoreductase
MKALQLMKYGDIEDSLAFNDISKPRIGENDVLIEVKAVAINPIDKGIILGNLKGLLSFTFPVTLGYDVSGTVVEKGKAVNNFNLGDQVYSRVPQEQMGTLAEYVAVNSHVVALKPTNISYEEAASFPLVGLTSLQCLEYVGISKNDIVLIHAGSGGVGSFAVQYAKAKGAFVYTTTGTDNVKWVKELGADRVIDYKTEDYKTIVKDATIVFDTLGKKYTLEAFGVIKPGGKVVSIIGPLDIETATMFGMADYKMPEELIKAIKSKDASYKYIWMHPDGEELGQIKSLIEAGKIKPVIDKIYSFSESTEAFLHLASGRSKGKIVIKIK